LTYTQVSVVVGDEERQRQIIGPHDSPASDRTSSRVIDPASASQPSRAATTSISSTAIPQPSSVLPPSISALISCVRASAPSSNARSSKY
jgi:hypothetical protein